MPGRPLCRLPGRLSLRRLLATAALLGATALAQAAPPFRDDMAQRTLACTACHGDRTPDWAADQIAARSSWEGHLYSTNSRSSACIR